MASTTEAQVHFPTLTPLTTTSSPSSTHSLPSVSRPTTQAENECPSLADGRRNSQGQVLTSPIESWKPDFQRTQSFQREELKRKVYGKEMGVGAVGEELGVDGKGEKRGFTEGGEGTRRV